MCSRDHSYQQMPYTVYIWFRYSVICQVIGSEKTRPSSRLIIKLLPELWHPIELQSHLEQRTEQWNGHGWVLGKRLVVSGTTNRLRLVNRTLNRCSIECVHVCRRTRSANSAEVTRWSRVHNKIHIKVEQFPGKLDMKIQNPSEWANPISRFHIVARLDFF